MVRLPKAYYESKDYKTRTQIRANQHRKILSSMEDALETNRVSDVQTSIETNDAEHDQHLIQGLDIQWLKFAAPKYHISPKIEDYILVSTLICPSEIPNRNGIAFPTLELAAFQPPPMNRTVWEAWKGCPVHLEHDNEDHTKAYGVILDTSFHKVHGYGGGKLWKVMGLLAIDKNKHPDIAQKILTGEINTYSMGALVDEFRCGYCNAICTATHVCSHISSIKNVNWGVHKDWEGNQHLSFLNAYGISPIECSIVADPAWAPALSDTVWEYETSKHEPDVKRIAPVADRSPGGGSSIQQMMNLKW